MKSYHEKNNLHYFTFSLNSEKPMKAVICHLPPDTPAEDIQHPGGLRLQRNQREANDGHSRSTQRTNPRGNPHSIPCYLNKKHNISKYIQVERLNHIIIKGRVIQSSKWPYAVLQLPKLWPCLGQLQATPSMFVVQWWPPA
jgi:hypothetical protein